MLVVVGFMALILYSRMADDNTPSSTVTPGAGKLRWVKRWPITSGLLF
jgi:hypothetical protein